jgi:LPXTG-motif cell wall-anchored protein
MRAVRYRRTIREGCGPFGGREDNVRKILITAGTAVASLGIVGLIAPGALATYPPGQGGPVPSVSVSIVPPGQGGPIPSVSVEPPVIIRPGPEVDSGAVVAGAGALPSTGSDSMLPIQIGAGLIVAGVAAIVIVRRRKIAPAL